MSQPHIQDLLAIRRRDFLAGAAAIPLLSFAEALAQTPARNPSFARVPANTADAVTVPPGYRPQTLVRWGDALFDNMTAFNPDTLTRADQEQRWGQNNDMLAIFPAQHAFPPPRGGDEFILCANNEYADPAMMFPSVGRMQDLTPAQIETTLSSIGVTVTKIARTDREWRVVTESAPGAGVNRRITPFTPVTFTGPASNHPWITAAAAAVNAREPGRPHEPNPPGAVRCGTQANCAGGQTPWGTYLSSEENFNMIYANGDPDAPALAGYRDNGPYVLDAENFGYPGIRRAPNSLMPAQFQLSENPTGPALYGWVVEIDPYNGQAAPKKLTALGRKKGECATTALTKGGRVAVYMGDDQINEYLYKFISRRRFNARDRAANMSLLDEGKLYVAQMHEDGTGRWIELTVSAANRAARDAGYPNPFADEGDLMMRTREAARLLGATPLDRPEDVEALLDPNWVGLGPVLVVCTNNREQRVERPGAPTREGSTRAQANLAGHILRLDEAGGDCGARAFRWDVFALAGDPGAAEPIARTPAGTPAFVSTKQNGVSTFEGDRFACPDNLAIDSAYNVWIATDGSDAVFGDCNDSVLVTTARSEGVKDVRRFLVGPVGAEICGPTLAPDERAFLCAIQHPGENDANGVPFTELRWGRGQRTPISNWPDGGQSWPRASVVVVTKDDGGIVGT